MGEYEDDSYLYEYESQDEWISDDDVDDADEWEYFNNWCDAEIERISMGQEDPLEQKWQGELDERLRMEMEDTREDKEQKWQEERLFESVLMEMEDKADLEADIL